MLGGAVHCQTQLHVRCQMSELWLHAQAYALSGVFWTTFPELLHADGKGLGLSSWIAANCTLFQHLRSWNTCPPKKKTIFFSFEHTNRFTQSDWGLYEAYMLLWQLTHSNLMSCPRVVLCSFHCGFHSTLVYTRAKLNLRFLHMVVAMINSLPKVGCCWNHSFQSERTFNIFWRSKQTTFVANFRRTKQHSRGTQCPRNTFYEDFEVQDFRRYSNRSANS